MILKIVTSIAIALLMSACATHEFKIDPKYTLEIKEDAIYSLKEGNNVSMKELVKELEHYPVIFVGDRHDVNETHLFLKDLLDALAEDGYNLHFANEWFSPEHNKLLEEYTADDINSSELKKRREWDKVSSYNWELDAMLYESIKKSNGKIYGVNISKENRKKISLNKLDKMNQEEKDFYNSLDLNVSAHISLVQEFFSHCHMMPTISDEDCAKRMYRVQVTWDTYMAKQSAKIAKNVLKEKKDKLIVFAGGMHMLYGLGIPLRFSRESNLPFFIISNANYTPKEPLEIDCGVSDALFLYKTKK